MALQFSRVVGKMTSLYSVMFTPKLGLENMDPGMALPFYPLSGGADAEPGLVLPGQVYAGLDWDLNLPPHPEQLCVAREDYLCQLCPHHDGDAARS